MALRKKHLSLFKHNYINVLKEYRCFGWSVSRSRELTTYTTETVWKSRYEYDNTLRVWAEENTTSSTTIEVDVYRYDEDIPMLWLVDLLGFLNGVVSALWPVCAIAVAYLILTQSSGFSSTEGFIMLAIIFVINFLLAKFLKSVICGWASNIIEKG